MATGQSIRYAIRRSAFLKVASSDTREAGRPVTVVDRSEGGVRICLEAPVEPETDVQLRLDTGESLNGNVRYCRAEPAGEYHAGIAFKEKSSVIERRSEVRFPVSGEVTVMVTPAERPATRRVIRGASLCDVSRNGMGVILPESIEVGSEIVVALESSEVHGIVRNCISLDSGLYRVGLGISGLHRSQAQDAALAVFAHQNPHPAESRLERTTRGLLRDLKKAVVSKLPLSQGRSGAIDRPSLSTSQVNEATAATDVRACRILPEQGSCLLGPDWRGQHNCALCRTIEDWKEKDVQFVLARRIPNGKGLEFEPGCCDGCKKPVAACWPLAGADTRAVRADVQGFAGESTCLWVTRESCCDRVL